MYEVEKETMFYIIRVVVGCSVAENAHKSNFSSAKALNESDSAPYPN